MEIQGRGFPKRCRCGETVVMKTSGTAKNPGRLFHACPHRKEGDNWYHTFKWTDTCMVEELEDLIDKVENIEESSMTLQKGFNVCESEIDTLAMETHMCKAVVAKEVGDLKMQLCSLKNLVGFGFAMWLVYVFLF
ncbi:hypothetical protein EUTSA_v10017745mg [Eutrema salsugineum]|uniref:GRF-type domain-containing protein n=1 Tax=Eutrema salsugineum TaxID=72664 RepID=V4MBK3_EUTSA|nr:uncharacterized protein At4g04775 [Eutrema salsugineum]ESQ52492.1 hypothetical protein EUTSA_v10017745mg [Eutrema salsugineum]